MVQVGESNALKGAPPDKWAEWKHLAFHDVPSSIRALGPLLRALLLGAVAVGILRAAFWSVIQGTKPLMDSLRGADWPQVTVILFFIAAVVAVLTGVFVCIYRYIDTR